MEAINEEKNVFELRGIYIPTEVFMNKKLDKTCWVLFDLVYRLDHHQKHCWANNRYFATLLDVSTTTISTSFSLLKELGYIEISFFKTKRKGDQRIIRIAPDYKEKHKNFRQLINERYRNNLDENEQSKPFNNTLNTPIQNDIYPPEDNLIHIKDNNIYKTKNNIISSKDKSLVEICETGVSPTPPHKKIILRKRALFLKGKDQLKSKLPLRKNKKQNIIKFSEQSIHLLKYWEGKGLKQISHKPETKAYQKSLQTFDRLRQGKIFNNSEYSHYENHKFNLKDIRTAIDRFALMALHEDYEPRSLAYKQKLSKMYPHDFIFNSFVSESNGYGRSIYIYCFENDAKLIKEKDINVEDKHPTLTNAIMRKYKQDILGMNDFTFTNDDINSFRKASLFAYDLFFKNKHRLMGSYRNLNPAQIASAMFEALEQSGANPTKIKPYWLHNSVMKKQFPAYLYQSAILQDSNAGGNPNVTAYNFGKPYSE